jgi:hypothetical protein
MKKGRVQFDYAATDAKQISLIKGQVITVHSHGNPGSWSKGEEIGTGKVGFYPTDYVQLIVETASSDAPPPPSPRISLGAGGINKSNINNAFGSTIAPPAITQTKIMAKVLYPFEGKGSNEMPLAVGDIIEVTTKGAPGGWCKGSKGAFPTDYVEFLPVTTSTVSSVPIAPNVPVARDRTESVRLSLDSFYDQPIVKSSVDTSAAVDPFAAIDQMAGSTKIVIENPALNNNLLSFDSTTATQPATTPIVATKPLTENPLAKPHGRTSHQVNKPTNIMEVFAGLSNTSTDIGSGSTSSSMSAVSSQSTVRSSNEAIGNLLDLSPVTQAQPVAKVLENPFDSIASTVPVMTPQVSATQSSISDLFAQPLVSSQTTATGSSQSTTVSSNHAPPQVNRPPPPAPMSAPKTIYAQVLYTRAAQGPTELSITEGETLIVLKQDGEWWYGSALSSAGTKVGFFPGNYVQLVSNSSPDTFVAAQPTYKPEVIARDRTASDSSISSSQIKVPRRDAHLGSVYQPVSGKNTYTYTPPNAGNEYISTPIWYQPFFLDMYADEYKSKFVPKDTHATTSGIKRMHVALHAVRISLMRVNPDDQLDGLREILQHSLRVFTEACDMCERIPAKSGDHNKFWSFLATFVVRVKTLAESESLVVPVCWPYADGKEHAVLIVVTKFRKGTDSDYSLAVINTGDGERGLDRHAVTVDNEDGNILRNLSFQLVNIPNERITNTAFWLLMFKSTVQPNPKYGSKFFYERLLTYLVSMPILSALQLGAAIQLGFNDFRPIPVGGDLSFINCAIECARYIARQCGIDVHASNHLPLLVRWGMLENVKADLDLVHSITPVEIDMLNQAAHHVGKSAAAQMKYPPSISKGQLDLVNKVIFAVEDRLARLDSRKVSVPEFTLTENIKLNKITANFDLFGRLRRDADIEHLAGEAPVPPIYRPIELTLVAEKVSSFTEVALAMRHAVNLCCLLSNQRDIVRNSYTLRVCLITHLFTRVIPLPLPITSPRRKTECFWHAQPIRYETQADILRLLNLLCRHFACASLSVKSTRSGDAIRMLTFACMATVCDASLRKIATDIPAQSALHYSGVALGPVQPFGFDMGSFAEESEYLKFTTPENAAARTQVLDYFHELKKIVDDDYMLFNFETGNKCQVAERRFIDQVCVQVGFERGHEIQYITGVDQLILDHYPEIGFFRDIIFMLKLVMVPTSEKLPELKPWLPTEAALHWSLDGDQYVVHGFNRKLDCNQAELVGSTVEEVQVNVVVKQKGLFSRFKRLIGINKKNLRADPSQANPSVLLGERVDTEDDILHIRNLPDFDGALGARDCELMLQYLTAPYLRIPLLLNFFSSEARLKTLRNPELQEVLDAAMFEPGQFKEEDVIAAPTVVPASTRNHLCTAVGLLFNEIITTPNIILQSIHTMLERVCEMDSGTYSELSDSILYVVRLAIRVEGYLLFLVVNTKFHEEQKQNMLLKQQYNGAYQEARYLLTHLLTHSPNHSLT